MSSSSLSFWRTCCTCLEGKLAKVESEEHISLLSFGEKMFRFLRVGSWLGFFLAPGEREVWKERHWSIIDNDVRDAVVENPEYQFEAAAAFGTCRSQREKLEAVQSLHNIQFFIKGVRGAQTQVVRRGCHVALGLVGSWVWMCTPWLEGGSWTTRYLWKVWESRRTALCPSSHGFVVGLVRTCLDSGRAQIASRSVAAR